MLRIKNLLRIDAGAAALSGATSALFGGWMARWFDLPRGLLTTLACISFAYALYSGSLAWRGSRSSVLITVLVVANAAYAVACCFLAARFWGVANGLGIGYLLLEAAFVAVLAWMEWRAMRREAATLD